jgi:hypothetical protein
MEAVSDFTVLFLVCEEEEEAVVAVAADAVDTVESVELRVDGSDLCFVWSRIAAFISFSISVWCPLIYSRIPFSKAQRKKFSFPTVVRKDSCPGIWKEIRSLLQNGSNSFLLYAFS